MKLDTSKKVGFPTVEDFGAMHVRFHKALVNGLSSKFCRADREDAVSAAFEKLMVKKAEEYDHVPETESEWFHNILWQCRAYLSHLAEFRDTWEGYHKKASEARIGWSADGFYAGFDSASKARWAWSTLYALCDEEHISPRRVAACVRWWLEGESSADVAKDTGITANNLYQIRFKLERLLQKKGRLMYHKVQHGELGRVA